MISPIKLKHKRVLGKRETRQILAESQAQMGQTAAESNVAYYDNDVFLTSDWYNETTCPDKPGLYQGLVSSVVSSSGKTKIVRGSNADYQVIRMFWWTGKEWLHANAVGKRYKYPLIWRGLINHLGRA